MARDSYSATEYSLGTALAAAIAALRSYQFGNSAADLAQEVADNGVAAMRAAKLGDLLIGGDKP